MLSIWVAKLDQVEFAPLKKIKDRNKKICRAVELGGLAWEFGRKGHLWSEFCVAHVQDLFI